MTEPVEQEITTWRDSWTGHKRFNLKEPSIHRTPGLSIVIPLYNELLNLDQLLEECVSAGESLGIPWELILVDDGSTDGSQQYLKDKVSDTVRVLAFAFNSGQSAAMEAGMRAARFDKIATLDGDLQNDPRDIALLLPLLENADMACGIRAKRRDSAFRVYISKFANSVRRRITDDGVTDTGCTLKVFRTEVADQLYFFKGAHRFMPAFARMAGYTVDETAVSHRARTAGETKYTWHRRLRDTIPDLFGFLWMKSRYNRYEVHEL
ncbi:MAG TPA: glycosyltransferase [Phycisphaerales bacterium]|nr:glycosyltransferase [Phycisphaerales bacterium]